MTFLISGAPSPNMQKSFELCLDGSFAACFEMKLEIASNLAERLRSLLLAEHSY